MYRLFIITAIELATLKEMGDTKRVGAEFLTSAMTDSIRVEASAITKSFATSQNNCVGVQQR